MEKKTLDQILDEIYADSKVSPGEIKQLKDFCDRAHVELLHQVGDEGIVNALCKSFEVTVQLLQQAVLKVRKEKASDSVRDALTKVINSHIELLKANASLFNK